MTIERKLFNKGSRIICHSGVVFLPQKAVSFPSEDADKLMALYGQELIDMENVTVSSLMGSQSDDRLSSQLKAEEEAISKRLELAIESKRTKAKLDAESDGFTEEEANKIAGIPSLEETKKNKKSK